MGLWRDIFGPGQNEVWGNIAQEIGADFSPDGWLKRGRIDLIRPGFVITMDTYTTHSGSGTTRSSHTYTRMRSPFSNHNNLAMNIYRQSIFSSVGKMFGMQDIVVGDRLFDDEFVIQGKPEKHIIKFLRNEQIRHLIGRQPDVCFQIEKNSSWFFKQYPSGIDELSFQCRGVLSQPQALRDLFELFVSSIDTLSEIDPGCQFATGLKPA